MMELLSPAGSPEAVIAAVQNGADAVYLGLGDFNARRGAHNFTPEEFEKAVQYCHLRNCKVYVTLNTLVNDRELASALAAARLASSRGADAILVQDLGLAKMIREALPDIPLHASTQMSIHNLAGAEAAAQMGITRVVLARELNLEEIRDFIARHRQKALERGEKPKFLLYGFTFMIWQYFVRALEQAGVTLDLEGSVLIHGGGWKKLQAQAVSPQEFASRIRAVTGIRQVRSYYGMAEQTGSICMECECGHLHASTWSDILIRRPEDYSLCETGEKGIIQVLSPLAGSYPGHSLLTEDQGMILGEDDCPCGRKGKYFRILGRIPRAEVRGCSDTYEG